MALSAVAALALSGCSVFDSSGSSDEAPRDEANGQITETTDADVFSIKVGDYPGDDAVSEQADTFCYDQFTTFVGIPWDDSALEYSPLTPTADSWDGYDDRLVQCVVASQEDVTVTFKGSQL